MNPSAKRPHVSTGGDVAYSPYIVRLSAAGVNQEEEDMQGYAAKEEAPLVELVLGEEGLSLRSEEERALLEQLLPEEDEQVTAFIPAAVAAHGEEDLLLEVADIPAPQEVQLQRLANALALLDHQEVRQPEAPVVVTHFGSLPATAITPVAQNTPLPFRHPVRMAVSFASLTLLVTAPLHAAQLASQSATAARGGEGAAKRGAAYLLGAAGTAVQGGVGAAQADFTQAMNAFREAQGNLQSISPILSAAAAVVPSAGKALNSARALTEAGEQIAQGAATLTAGFDDFQKRGSLSPSERLALITSYFAAAEPNITAAAQALQEVDVDTVPQEYRSQVTDAQRMVGSLAKSLQEFTAAGPILQQLLGADQPVKYLVAFQNNTELRPTGGFIGSFAEVTINKGELEKVVVPPGGSYAMQGQMTARVAAPPPLQLLRAKWEFQDANWFPDFPMSARKLQWFYEKSGGPTTDGVLAVNAAFLEELLAIIGAVTLADGTEVNSENVLRVMRQDIDARNQDPSTTTAPKVIVGDLVDLILARLKEATPEDFLKITSAVLANLSDRDLQVYMADNTAQRLVQQAGFDGGLKNAPDDYLMVVNTNLGGGKTDRIIDQRINVQSQILPDGSVENQVTITKKHNGLPGRGVEGVNNVDFLRLYVPEGATVISVSGSEVPPAEAFESDATLETDSDLALHLKSYTVDPKTSAVTWSEAGKTVIGAWMQTAPQEEQMMTIVYRVPGSAFASVRDQANGVRRHTLFIQAPSGVHTRQMNVRMVLPAGATSIYQTNDALTGAGVQQENTDGFMGLVYNL